MEVAMFCIDYLTHFSVSSRKSTIIRLLYRFFDPEAGEICIAGKKINAVNLDSLRKAIAVVPQVGCLCFVFVTQSCNFNSNLFRTAYCFMIRFCITCDTET